MITRPISKSISRGIALAINDPNGAGFNPLSLFASGEQGVWYDPSDMSTLFQDAAGTIPVTAAGQPVGRMLDKSGRGNHATQSTATSRPILQTASGEWYLAFDGVDDGMATADINFTATDKMTAWAGVFKQSDAAIGMVCELSNNINNNNGCFSITAPSTAGSWSYQATSKGTVIAGAPRSGQAIAAPHTGVLTMQSDIAAPSVQLRVNTTVVAPVTDTQGTGGYGTYPLFIGRRVGASLSFNGRIYSLIVRGAASTAQQITDTENYVNSKTGAY